MKPTWFSLYYHQIPCRKVKFPPISDFFIIRNNRMQISTAWIIHLKSKLCSHQQTISPKWSPISIPNSLLRQREIRPFKCLLFDSHPQTKELKINRNRKICQDPYQHPCRNLQINPIILTITSSNIHTYTHTNMRRVCQRREESESRNVSLLILLRVLLKKRKIYF